MIQNKNIVNDILQMFGLGTTGAGLVEAAYTIPMDETIKYICQAVIALATVYTLYRKSRRHREKPVNKKYTEAEQDDDD